MLTAGNTLRSSPAAAVQVSTERADAQHVKSLPHPTSHSACHCASRLNQVWCVVRLGYTEQLRIKSATRGDDKRASVGDLLQCRW